MPGLRRTEVVVEGRPGGTTFAGANRDGNDIRKRISNPSKTDANRSRKIVTILEISGTTPDGFLGF
jgi:hypothetical protein